MRAFSARERTLAIATIAVLVTWAAVSGLALPLWERLSWLRQRAEGSQEKLARLTTLMDRRGSIERQFQRYGVFFSDQPDERLQSEFLDELEQLAGAGNLQLDLKPRSVQHAGRLSRMTVELNVDGTQADILGFLDELLTSPSLMDIERFRLSTTTSAERPVQVSLVVTKAALRQASSK